MRLGRSEDFFFKKKGTARELAERRSFPPLSVEGL
jgi:hypothetical protein